MNMNMNMNMKKKAVILAGGLGTRLKPFTNVIPKSLLPIGEKALLEIQIERLASFGFNEIYIATNYLSEYIEKFLGDGSRYGVNLYISREEIPLGTAGPLKLLKNMLNDPFIVMNGDILSLINFNDLFDFSLQINTKLTVCIKKVITPFSFGNIISDGDFVIDIQEKPDIITYALAGIYVLKPDLLNLIPENKYFGIDNLIKILLKKHSKIAKYEIKDYWVDIGRVEDYNAVINDLQK